ncbi:MAG TPA: helix-turn-helix domain-containing protein, partial [Candidatus Kryptonia bacterium]|nr:helix-turn-helix domain-containing protein [Candidatus Kryptonia bacterium]
MARVVRPEATLEQWLATGTPRQRRLAAIVLARQRGMLIESIARQVGVHRETVRRWLVRYRRDGLTTVKEVRRTVCWVFNREIRARIVAVAMRPPTDQGAACDHWSLLKLRAHLVRAGVVKHISIERLRYILNEANGRPRSWREPLAQPIRVTLDERNRLRQMCEVASLKRRVAAVLAVADDCPVKAVAVDFGMAESTVRRWVQRYRDGGSGALMRSPV